MRRPSVLLLLALTALAGAPPRVAIPEGTRIRLFDVGPKDAWYGQRANLADLECTVGPGPLKPARATWFRGNVHCDDARDYVFYQVTFESMSTLGPTAEGCPTGSWVGGNLPEGSRVRVLGMSPSDGYYGSADLPGRMGTVTYGELYPSRGPKSCWFGGTLVLDDPTGAYSEYYFYEVAIALESKGAGPVYGYGGEGYYPTYAEPACAPEAFTGSTLGAGARVAIVDIHPEDAYYSVRYDHIGKMGSVDGDLHNNSGTCWFGGGFIGDDGTSYYFYKAAVRLIDGTETGVPSCAEGVATASIIPKGNRVKIVDIHPEDAYWGSRFSVIGHTATATEELELMDGCWYAGPMRSDDGQDWYFFKASIVDLGTPQ